jgi:hypothetical protein
MIKKSIKKTNLKKYSNPDSPPKKEDGDLDYHSQNELWKIIIKEKLRYFNQK